MAPKKAAAKKKGGGKPPKAAKREKFAAPVNTKTGAKGDAAAGKAEAAFVSTSRMTPGSFLKSLLTECRGFKKNVDSIVGSMRERIAYGKEKKNLHTGVFGWLRKIDGMEAEKAAEWHGTYMHYLETSGLMAKIDSVQRLPMGDKPEVEGEDDEAEAESTAGNGARDGGGEASEAAGIKPAANGGEPAPNVTRPRFGQRPPAGISGTDLAAATGTDTGKPH